MRPYVILIALVILFPSFVVAEEKEDSGLQGIRRYQLIVVTLWDPRDQRSVPTLAKIDTVSGRVWILQTASGAVVVGGEKSSVLIEGWYQADKNFMEAMSQYEKINKRPAKE
jgi:hypothetical protein